LKSLALYRAKAAVIAQIRADNLKLGQFSSREINEKREAYFAQHMEELITKALADVWRFPEFARHRNSKSSPSGTTTQQASEPLDDIEVRS
jgi:hypothetical protein